MPDGDECIDAIQIIVGFHFLQRVCDDERERGRPQCEEEFRQISLTDSLQIHRQNKRREFIDGIFPLRLCNKILQFRIA